MKNDHVQTILFAALLLVLLLPASDARAVTAEEKFFKADVCHKKFMEDEEGLKYRDNWFPCIRMFQDAYRSEPAGKYAPASLFRTGQLYHQLYLRSFLGADRQEALDYYQRAVKRFPGSAYTPRAQKGIEELGGKAEEASASSKSESTRIKRVKVEKELSDPEKETAKIPHKSRDKAVAEAKARYRSRGKRVVTPSPPKKSAPPAPAHTPSGSYAADSASPSNSITVTGLRVWSNPKYTRVVVDADAETGYRYRFLNEDPDNDKPQRLYIDFSNALLGEDIRKIIPINDDLLMDARAGQFTKDSVRVVVDIKSFKNYKIFSLRNPFRTIIDVWGRDANAAQSPPLVASSDSPPLPNPSAPPTPSPGQILTTPPPKEERITPHDLARQFGLGVRRIVIDPGHGGRDGGAVGYRKNVLEKDITLSLARRLAAKIRARLGCEVILTRDTDRYVALEERTAIANTQNADLFISIHTNAHRDRNAYGIETYFLNLATDEDAMRVAQRENAVSRKNISDLQAILNDLLQNAKINESSRLAAHIQKTMIHDLKGRYSNINDKGVKQAPFYVLIGAQMPAVLVETSFISNRRECGRLTDGAYQDHLSEAILKGIRDYIIETNPTAFTGRQLGIGG